MPGAVPERSRRKRSHQRRRVGRQVPPHLSSLVSPAAEMKKKKKDTKKRRKQIPRKESERETSTPSKAVRRGGWNVQVRLTECASQV